MIAAVVTLPPAPARAAERDLSGFGGSADAFTVSITINPPPDVFAVGIEETPPAGWPVSAISDGGTWDAQTGKIKWGPFFDPSIPAGVHYDVTVPDDTVGPFCFNGAVSFDGNVVPVGGDSCLAVGMPAVSWAGLVALGLMLAGAALWTLGRRIPVPQ